MPVIDVKPKKEKMEYYRKIVDGELKLDKRRFKFCQPDGSLRSILHEDEKTAKELREKGLI